MMPWILIAIVAALILIGILVIFVSRKHKRPPDYYNLFIIGMIWAPLGIILNNSVLWVLGVAFLIIGLVNRKKWKANRRRWENLSKSERKLTIWIMIILGILILLGFVIWFLAEKGIL